MVLLFSRGEGKALKDCSEEDLNGCAAVPVEAVLRWYMKELYFHFFLGVRKQRMYFEVGRSFSHPALSTLQFNGKDLQVSPSLKGAMRDRAISVLDTLQERLFMSSC